MRTLVTLLAAAAIATFGFTAPAMADGLDAPENLTCNVGADLSGDLVIDWDSVTGAEKYAVDIICLDGDVVTAEFDAGTSDCSTPGSFLFTDEDCDISVTEMTVPISELTDLGADTGDACTVFVRGLHKRGTNRPTVHLQADDLCADLPPAP